MVAINTDPSVHSDRFFSMYLLSRKVSEARDIQG
jgi:hypothetical protein